MNKKPVLSDSRGGAALAVHLKTTTGDSRIVSITEGEVTLSIHTEKGQPAAEKEIIQLLADTLGLAKSKIDILPGVNSDACLVLIYGLDAEVVNHRLKEKQA